MIQNFAQTYTRDDDSLQSTWDLDAMVEQVIRSLHKEVDPSTIRDVLVEILAGFKNVPIQTYVPVLACREAKNILKN